MFDTLVDKYINFGSFTYTYDIVAKKGFNTNSTVTDIFIGLPLDQEFAIEFRF